MKPSENFELYPSVEEVLKHIDERIALSACPPDQVIWNNDQLCKELNVSKRTVATWRSKGKIIFSKIDGLIFYTKKDVLAFLEEHKVKFNKRKSRIA